MAHDVFISYSNKDKPIADAICSSLEQNKIKCWYAPRDVSIGKNYSGEITRAIKKSKIFILIFSSHSNLSKDVLNEVKISFENNLVIISFKIDNTYLSDDLQYFIGNPHWLDALSPPIEKHLKQLVIQVSKNINLKINDINVVLPKKNKLGGRIIWSLFVIFWIIIFILIWNKYYKPHFSNNLNNNKPSETSLIQAKQKPKENKSTTINENGIEINYELIEIDFFLNREVNFQGKRLRFEEFWKIFIISSEKDGLTVSGPECIPQYSNFIIRYHVTGTSNDGKIWNENVDFEVNSKTKYFQPVSSLAITLTNVLDE